MSNFLPAVRRARIVRLDIYEISESELALLERGSPDSLFLNFAIASISAALSFMVTLLTTDISSLRTFTVLVVLCVSGFVAGLVLSCLWLWFRRTRTTVFSEIRRRMPPDGLPLIDAEPPKVRS